MKLTNKTIIVTGSTKGLGKWLVEGFLADGANVYVTGLRKEECEAVASEFANYTGNAIGMKMDITQKKDVTNVIAHAVENFGKIDVLVNNAAYVGRKSTFDIDESFFDQMSNTNVRGTFFLTQSVAKHMVTQKSGKIINISSASGKLIRKGLANPIYSMNKAAIDMMTKALAEDLAKYNINVNAIAPGYFYTELVADRFQSEEYYRNVIESTPLQRIGGEKDITGIATFLASEEANFITGQIIYVDGGRTVL